MKILMVALFSVRSCGPTEVLKKVVPELINLGNNVDVLSPYPYDKEKEDLAHKLGMAYYYSENAIISVNDLKKSVPNIEDYDVLHFHGIYEYRNWMLARIVHKIGKPYVYTIHGNLMRNALKKGKTKKAIAIKIAIRSMLDRAKAIHALSQNEAEDIKHITNSPIITIPNGVDTVDTLKRNKKSKDRVIFLFIGRIDIRHKGIDLLYEAVKSLNKGLSDRCEFVIAGPFESEYDREYIENNNISNIHYIGPVYDEDKMLQLSKCDYFIHTSRYEGMPMAVLEALSLGIPCLVTCETNMSDIIKAANAGFIADCNVESIVYSVEEAIEKGGSIEVNVDWIEKHLLWADIAKQYEKMYHN